MRTTVVARSTVRAQRWWGLRQGLGTLCTDLLEERQGPDLAFDHLQDTVLGVGPRVTHLHARVRVRVCVCVCVCVCVYVCVL